jgi:dipeptidyl aminopeptidase/acylaminoacyl peptidase
MHFDKNNRGSTMIKYIRKWIALIPVLMMTTLGVVQAKEFPVEHFFKTPEFAALQLSPNGKKLMVLKPAGKNNRMNIYVMDIENDFKTTQVTGIDAADVTNPVWVNNERIIYSVDEDGNESPAIFAVNANGKRQRVLFERGEGATQFRRASLLNLLPDDDKHILVTWNKNRIAYTEVFKVNIYNGRSKRVLPNTGYAVGWMTDWNGDVRIAIEQQDLETRILYRKDTESEFEVINKFQTLERSWGPVGFDFDNKTLIVQSNIETDTAGLYFYDPEKRQMGELIYNDDTYDIGGPWVSRHKQKLIGVVYMADKPKRVMFDKEWATHIATLEATFPGEQVSIASLAKDESRMIIRVWSDRDPGSYYMYEPTNTKRPLFKLVQGREWIKPEDMVPMMPIKYTARDGLTIHGYLTLPKNWTKGSPVPLIVNPHGGPWARDGWGWNPEVQMFANRGYATLQMDFRGSTGYGLKHRNDGNGEWGNKMQHDITDGVKWAIEQGYADADKVCISGTSYGGYATMAGLTFTPDLYKCGINNVGVTDVALLFETMDESWGASRARLMEQVGDAEDKEFMAKISPVKHVDKIKAPVMIIHGRKDPRVVMQHADDLRDELERLGKKEGVDYEWLVKSNEGHGFRKQENIIEQYEKMDEFLKRFLK